jgi:[acyl-carrier-protein] S-malonyltransferase
MSKIAFIFPGQGAQYVGMGMEISREFSSADRIFDHASEILQFDVKKMVFEGDSETLMITENTQPAILATSIACMQPLVENGILPVVSAGLSLGEYSAHVAAGTMSFADAITLVKKRGKYMQEAVPVGVGAMAAIIGLDNQEVVECCRLASDAGIIEPVNFNCPGQVAIAGEKDGVKRAMELCSEKGAKRSILLNVSAPFHCRMMRIAGERLASELEKIELHEMRIPVVSNVTAEYILDNSIVKELLIRQVSSPVLWEDSVRTMLGNGVDTFVEIGPGKVLSGFIKKISKDVKILNVDNLEVLNKTLKEMAL